MSLSIDGVWKSGVWAPTVWADGVWREGAVVAEEEEAALAAVHIPVDFVISPPHYMHEIQTYRNSLGLAAPHKERANAADKQEMRQLYSIHQVLEMMKLYATFAHEHIPG